MLSQTITHAAESDLDPEKIYDVLVAVGNLPTWAPVFADSLVKSGDGRYRVTKSGESFDMQVVTSDVAGTVDYLREMQGGRRGGAYIRVMPRPAGGSTVVMTVPLGPNASADQVAGVLKQELDALLQLAAS
jgi:hypothetical protein